MRSLSVSSLRLYLSISFLPRWMVPVILLNSSLVSCTVLEEVAMMMRKREIIHRAMQDLSFKDKIKPQFKKHKLVDKVLYLPRMPMASSLCFTCSAIILLIDIRLSVMLLLLSTRLSLVTFLESKTNTKHIG